MTEAMSIGIECITQETPTWPDAKRGQSTPKAMRETHEQLDAGLIWSRCAFCNRNVLIAAERPTRERCECGAVRTRKTTYDYRGYGWLHEGWRRGKETWWSI